MLTQLACSCSRVEDPRSCAKTMQKLPYAPHTLCTALFHLPISLNKVAVLWLDQTTAAQVLTRVSCIRTPLNRRCHRQTAAPTQYQDAPHKTLGLLFVGHTEIMIRCPEAPLASAGSKQVPQVRGVPSTPCRALARTMLRTQLCLIGQ